MDTKESRQEKVTFINTKRLLAFYACTLATNNIRSNYSEIHVLLQDSPEFSMEISRFTVHSIDSYTIWYVVHSVWEFTLTLSL